MKQKMEAESKRNWSQVQDFWLQQQREQGVESTAWLLRKAAKLKLADGKLDQRAHVCVCAEIYIEEEEEK